MRRKIEHLVLFISIIRIILLNKVQSNCIFLQLLHLALKEHTSVLSMNAEDAVAGIFLILFGVFGIILYSTIIYSMLRMSREIVGFRFLVSQGISDILLMLQFGIWPGFIILCQSEIVPEGWRWHLHVYLDFTWWTMVYHYAIVAWSRMAAVQWPNWFRTLPYGTCVLICLSAWFLGLVQSLVEHQFAWFVTLYYNPERYGMDADWARYASSGTKDYYMGFNIALMVLPFPFYLFALCIVYRRNCNSIGSNARVTGGRSASLTPLAAATQRQFSIERRLLIPCFVNTLLFVAGQLFIFYSPSQGKWMTWAVLVVFSTNAIANPILYLCFSSVIRKHVLFDCQHRFSLSAVYNDDCRSSLSQHRQSLLRARDTTISSDLNRVAVGGFIKPSISA